MSDIKKMMINAFEKNEIKSIDFEHNIPNLENQKLESKPESEQEPPGETIAERVKLRKQTNMPDLESEESAEKKKTTTIYSLYRSKKLTEIIYKYLISII